MIALPAVRVFGMDEDVRIPADRHIVSNARYTGV